MRRNIGPVIGMSAPKFKRTIKHAVDLVRMATITSDDLLTMHPDNYQEIRRSSTCARKDRQDRFVCGACGEPVYAPKEPRTKLPFWKHHPGAPHSCPWWSGEGSSVEAVSAQQFKGLQESPLHAQIKNTLGVLLELDTRVAQDSVVVDKYLVSEIGKRRPDVRAIYQGKRLAIEVQLASTQIPIIVGREDFYEAEGYRLLWITWRFEPVARSDLKSSFNDIFYSHNKNLFSIDDETISLSQERNEVVVRAFWEEGEGWASRLFALSELSWSRSGRAYAVSPGLPWHEDYKARWRAATGTEGTPWAQRGDLLAELASRVALDDPTGKSLEDARFDELINCMLSLVDGTPIGSRQSNLYEVLNTFLQPERRHRYARLIKRFVALTGQSDLMQNPAFSGNLRLP
jgi:hypothetical protein